MFTQQWWDAAVTDALNMKWEGQDSADASEEPPNRQ